MDDSRLDDLLDQYQELVDDGRVPNLAELCRDCPDLRDELGRRVARLHKLGKLLGDSAPSAALPEPPPLSLSDDRTWVHGSAGGGERTAVEIPAPPGYEVIEPIGEGGMGIVYKARQSGLGRLVALKMILGGARARAIDLTRFRDEAQAIATLRHPNVVQIYALGEFRNQPFFALEYCAGGTLGKALNGQPQPPALAARMGEVLARAVQSAHDRNIVHRDLKPGNVLLAIEGKPAGAAQSTMVGEGPGADAAHDALRDPEHTLKVTDFGLAKRVDDDSGRTLDGSVMGTPSYMAPEQARGELKAVGRPADVWALGAILYELLTGRPPFKGSTVLDTLEQVRSRDPVPVHHLQPRVPRDLETICLKCLEKEPARRYASAGALADDLRRFRDGKPIQARPVGQLTRTYRWSRREPRTALLVAGLLLLAAMVPAFLVGYEARLRRAGERLDQQKQLTAAAEQAEQEEYAAAQAHQYLAGASEAARRRARPQPGWTWEAREWVAHAAGAVTPIRDPVVLRSELAAALGGIDVRPIAHLAEGLQAGALAFAPDGRLAVAPQFSQPVASVRFVSVFDPTFKTETRLPFPGKITLKGPDMTTALAFSPDGRWLYLALRSGKVVRWDLTVHDPEEARAGWTAHDGSVAGIAFSPDSKWVYTAGHDGQVKRWPIGADKPAAVVPPKPADPNGRHWTGLAYWPNPKPGLLVHGKDGTRFLDPVTLAELPPDARRAAPKILRSPGVIVAHPSSGTILADHGPDADLTFWADGICQPAATLSDPTVEGVSAHADRIEGLDLHPSGMLAATVSPNEGLAKVWDLAGGDLAAAVPAPGGRAVAFGPDGRTLAVGGDHITTVYELGGLREQTYLGHRGFPVRAVGRTGDRRIGTVAVRRHPDRPVVSTIACVWEPDGKLVETVLAREEGPVGTGHFAVAGSLASGWTAFVAASGEIVWRHKDHPTAPAATDLRPRVYFDLSLDPDGRAWSVEEGERLGLRLPGAAGPKQTKAASWTMTSRKDLSAVRAAREFVVVGCENGHLRVVPTGNGPVRECACFEQNATTLFTDRANTVRAVDVTEDETRAVAGTEDGRLWLVGLPDAKLLAHWTAHGDRVTAVAFDRTGEWLASGGRDREVHLWQRSGDTYTPYLALQLPRPVRQVTFTLAGDLLVLLEGETAVRRWHLAELRKRFREANLE
jgi:eukaryotic-like serine/threonine-protein kinase